MTTSIKLSEFSSKSITHINYSLSLNQEMKFEDVPENYSVNTEIDLNYNQAEEGKAQQDYQEDHNTVYNNKNDQNYNQAEEGKVQQYYQEDHNTVSSEEFKANAKNLEENLSQESLDLENPYEGFPDECFLDFDEFKELQL